jgi:hypothetical protein
MKIFILMSKNKSNTYPMFALFSKSRIDEEIKKLRKLDEEMYPNSRSNYYYEPVDILDKEITAKI